MNLVLDIGNSRTKVAVFSSGIIVEKRIMENEAESRFDDILAMCGQQMSKAIISSTRCRQDDEALLLALGRHCSMVLWFDSSVEVPLENCYDTPHTLGCDRIAAAVGGRFLFPDRNLLIFDFGTAITADIITADGKFHGGSIAPGLWMRLQAMHDYTGRLPLIYVEQCSKYKEAKIPSTTVDALMSGAMEGIVFEIRGRMDVYGELFSSLVTIFTGGEASCFEKRFKNAIFADYDLVLAGLNMILEYNANK